METICRYCSKELTGSSVSFCSNQCQADLSYSEYIKLWKQGEVSGNRGTNTKNISNHLRRFILQKYYNKCSSCGWSEVNQVTLLCPLEIDHLDGDSNNNTEENLRILCPNCHSLTSNYRNLNKGNGREWRRARYVKVTPP